MNFSSIVLICLLLCPSTASHARYAGVKVLDLNNSKIGHCADLELDNRNRPLKEKLRRYSWKTRTKPNVMVINHSWSRSMTFPRAEVQAILSENMIPLIRIHPFAPGTKNGNIVEDFIEGFYNNELDVMMEDIISLKNSSSELPSPVMISFAPWPNQKPLPWSGARNGADSKYSGDPLKYDGPERYQDFYRYFVNFANKFGVRNITWVFEVDTPQDPISWNTIASYYPGDDIVDWLGLRVSGPDTKGAWSHVLGFEESLTLPYRNFESALDQVRAISNRKPIGIFDFSAVEDAFNSEAKASWIKGAFDFFDSNRQIIRMACYGNKSPRTLEDLEINSWFDSSSESEKTYSTGIRSWTFGNSTKLSRSFGSKYYSIQGIFSSRYKAKANIKVRASEIPTGRYYSNSIDHRRKRLKLNQHPDRVKAEGKTKIYSRFSFSNLPSQSKQTLFIKINVVSRKKSNFKMTIYDSEGKELLQTTRVGSLKLPIKKRNGEAFTIRSIKIELETSNKNTSEISISDVHLKI